MQNSRRHLFIKFHRTLIDSISSTIWILRWTLPLGLQDLAAFRISSLQNKKLFSKENVLISFKFCYNLKFALICIVFFEKLKEPPKQTRQTSLDGSHRDRGPLIFLSGSTLYNTIHIRLEYTLQSSVSIVSKWEEEGPWYLRDCMDPIGTVDPWSISLPVL